MWYAGMSFCCGSVNCHLSDGKIYHFCESPKSIEMFTGVEGGGVGISGHQHISLMNHQLSCQCHCLYLVQVPDNNDISRACSSD